jgi:HD-GYP domain-containing protein (c-di-GMP phosphodiesterase class II)
VAFSGEILALIMKGVFMSKLTLDYPVYSLDRHLLLPAGTTLSEDDFHALVSSSSADYQKKYSLMQFGTVRKDILDFIDQPPGNAVFSNAEKLAEVIELMEQVQLAWPKLDSIEYFKQYDSYTYRHILMVFAYLTLLSKELVPNYRTRIKEMATSPLHDFGKVCVPLEILTKASPLTRDERKTLEHHTTAGYILLCYYSQNVNQIAARVARDHHERNNGSGYPRGIRLNDRMVEIVAICDIYDALTSKRPYRPVSFDNRTALEHITMMAERNEVSWEVVQALVAHNRKGDMHFTKCIVSLDKRGIIPPNNVYGILAA